MGDLEVNLPLIFQGVKKTEHWGRCHAKKNIKNNNRKFNDVIQGFGRFMSLFCWGAISPLGLKMKAIHLFLGVESQQTLRLSKFFLADLQSTKKSSSLMFLVVFWDKKPDLFLFIYLNMLISSSFQGVPIRT